MTFTLFASVPTATGAEIDGNFAAINGAATIPCGVTGTNALSLTASVNLPVVSAYANYQIFSGIAAASNSGAVTAGVGSLASLPVYKDTASGPVVLSGGEIVVKNLFALTYDSALNSGGGGFHLQTGIATASGTFLPLAGGALTGPLSGTSASFTGPVSGASGAVTGLFSAGSLSASGAISGGSVVIGSSNAIKKMLSSIATVTFSSLAAATSQDQPVVFAGANINDTIMMGLPSLAVAGVSYNAFVASTGTITLRAFNVTASGVTPTGGSIRLTLMQF